MGNRKVQLRAEEVQGRNVILNFHGMSLTTDKLRSMLRKWCTLVEGSAEVKTSDGYTMRLFAIGFTEKAQDAMANKEWYDLCAPANFQVRHCGKTVANRTKGTFSGPESIKGRVFEVNLADLMSEDKDYRNRKVQLRAEEVQGRNVIRRRTRVAGRWSRRAPRRRRRRLGRPPRRLRTKH